MNMNIRIAVCVGNFFVINLGQPVIGCYRTGVMQNQTAYGIGNRRVFFYSPVQFIYITVYDFFVIKECRLHVADFFTIFTI